MNNKPIDRNKKSNIKCEHCKHYKTTSNTPTFALYQYCSLTGDEKNYWNRCEKFEWKEKGEQK